MRELITQDIWILPNGPADGIGITTNGIWKADGRAVMGAGMARQAAERFSCLPQALGFSLRKYGNQCFYFGMLQDKITGDCIKVVTFPTKYHWRDKSDMGLILRSCEQAMKICDKYGILNLYLTRPGCGHGGLDWETQVKPAISGILDDRLIIVENGEQA